MSGLATGLPHYRGQVRPAVLCVTAPSGLCKVGAPHESLPTYSTRHSGRRTGRNCHMFVKGLSAALDKEQRADAPGMPKNKERTLRACQETSRSPHRVQSSTRAMNDHTPNLHPQRKLILAID